MAWCSPDEEGHRYVLARRQRRKEIECLKHEADIPAAILRALSIAHAMKIVPKDRTFTRILVEDTRDHRDKRGFAAPGWPDEHEELTRSNIEIDPPQGVRHRIATAIRFRHRFAANRRRKARRELSRHLSPFENDTRLKPHHFEHAKDG
jgi:hypothetical protein